MKEKVTSKEFQEKYDIIDPDYDSGSYGRVALAQEKQTKTRVAIKYLKNKDHRQAFEEQAKIMQKIHHQNILECLGLYENTEKSKLMIVTPFCSRGNLKNNSEMITTFAEKQKVRLCLQIARGVNALHDRNFMHRDLKPQNILVTQNWELKICDLGFSKKDELSFMNTTRIGTPNYRDPNIILDKNYTKKCDIYSAGLVFYFIFRGYGYFEYCKDEHQLLREQGKFDNEKTEVIEKLNCSKHMKKIIIGCLQKSEDNRYDAKKLASNIEKLHQEMETGRNFQQNLRQFQENTKKSPHIKRLKTKNSEEDLKHSYHFYSNINDFKKKETFHSAPGNNELSQFNMDLLKTSSVNSSLLQKGINFKKIFTHLKDTKEFFKSLSLLRKIHTFKNAEKNKICAICFFVYLKKMITYEHFLEDRDCPINEIRGLRYDELTPQTRTQCLKFIKSQINLGKNSVSKYINDIRQSRMQNSQTLKQIITEAKDKYFTQIMLFPTENLIKEYQEYFINLNMEPEERQYIMKIRDLYQEF